MIAFQSCPKRRKGYGLTTAYALMGLVAGGSATAWAHHSPQGIYHTDRIVEVEGELTDILWRNPHVRFTIAATDEQGETASWTVESVPVTRLSRASVSPDIVDVGQRVRVAGYPSRRPENLVYALNMMLPDGREVLLDTPEPRWTNNTIGTGSDSTPGTRAGDSALGIFRVWSADETRLALDGDREFLTDAALAAEAAWDALARDNPFLGCTRGITTIMESPNPAEFVDRGDHILLRMESFDTVRMISMEPDAVSEDAPATLLGRSVGRWEGSTLVVETDRISWRYFSQSGLPSSAALELVERFTPSEDGTRLDYELTVTDPALFTQPVVFTKSWVWVPGDQVLPYDCAEG
jgi:hypothetical protein